MELSVQIITFCSDQEIQRIVEVPLTLYATAPMMLLASLSIPCVARTSSQFRIPRDWVAFTAAFKGQRGVSS
jgi:hypothetical protein